MGALFLLVGLGGVVGAWGAYLTDKEIERSGPRAPAYLVKKVFLEVADGDSDYILEYRFQPEAGPVVGASRSVSKKLWDASREGQLLEVRYSLENPHRNFPAGEGVTSLGVTVFVSVVTALLAAFGGALVWAHVRRARGAAA